MQEPEFTSSEAISRRIARTAPRSEAARLCRIWLAREAEIGGLTRRWQKLESYLFDHHRWPELTLEAQRNLPEAAVLHELDAQIDGLRSRQGRLLAELPGLVAESKDAVMLKFEVLANLLCHDDQPEVYLILRSAVSDLSDVWR